MKNNYKINDKVSFVVVLFFLCIQVGWAQNYEEEESENTEATNTELNGTEVSPEVFAAFGFDTTINPKLATVQGNSVFINQIGESNTVGVYTDTQASEIKVFQQGDYNGIALDYTVKKVVTDVKQLGDNNIILDYANNPDKEVSLDLTQQGDNLNFQRDGINDLTKSIKFTQTQASPTIIIRSYN